MKKKIQYIKTITVAFLVMVSSMAVAQNPISQKTHNDLEAKAVTITKQYDEQLGLTAKQQMLFKIKVGEYLIKEQKIRQSDWSVKQKFRALRKNAKNETADMGDILTRIQYRMYKRIKPQYQPIRPIVVGEVSEK